jgi:hypothetical protein
MQPAKFEQVINVQKGGALARREYARYGERSVRMIVEDGVGRPSPRNHQPKILDARSAKMMSEGGAGAFGPMAERS